MRILSKYWFWILNLAYWISYYLTQGLTSPVFLALPLYNRTLLCLTFIFWILVFTSIYRFIYKYFRFDRKDLIFTIGQSLLATLIMAFLDIAVRFTINGKIQLLLRVTNFDNNYNAFTRVFQIFKENPSSDIGGFYNQTSVNGQVMKFYAYAIWVLLYNFYHYYERLKTIEIEKLKTQNQLKDAELINLRQQLNPHFLFNALNGIHALVSLKNEKAEKAVINLSDLMRYSLNYGKREFVTVSEELDAVRQYLELEKIRFGERLSFKIEVQKDQESTEIPFAIVQTLTENAVKHGIQKSIEGGNIHVSVSKKVGFLKIAVVNSGQLTNSAHENKNGGIGLENIQQRLKSYYGKNAYFSLENLNENEVATTILLPL